MKKFIPLSIPDLRGNVKKHLIAAVEENWVSSAATGVKKFESDLIWFLGKYRIFRRENNLICLWKVNS